MKKVMASVMAEPSFISANTYQAEHRIFTVHMYGLSFKILMKERFIPEFDQKDGGTAQFISGISKGNQELGGAILDDAPLYQVHILEISAPLATNPSDADIHDIAKQDPNSIGIGGGGATGVTDATEWFRKEGWDPPSRWKDPTDPKSDQILSIPPPSNSHGLHARAHPDAFPVNRHSGVTLAGVHALALAPRIAPDRFDEEMSPVSARRFHVQAY